MIVLLCRATKEPVFVFDEAVPVDQKDRDALRARASALGMIFLEVDLAEGLDLEAWITREEDERVLAASSACFPRDRE